jgi:stage II sporulation protein D
VKFFKIITIALIFLLLLSALPLSAYALEQIPETIKIGLLFNEPKIGINKAVASFNASSENGIQIGFIKDNTFIPAYIEITSKSIIVRKDSFFARTAGSLSEYLPSGEKDPEGDKVGPFHIKIGDNYSDINLLNAQLEVIRNQDIKAYPVFADTLQIWTGFYTDESMAQNELENVVKQKLGEGIYSIVTPTLSRVVVENSSGETIALFDDRWCSLRLRSLEGQEVPLISLNGMDYRGDLEARRYSSSDMTVINVLPLEQYLYGVVPCEIEALSPHEAIKAQAVAARTYTLNNIGKYREIGFDLTNTTYCQVYKGYQKENPAVNNAVDETKGKVVMYNDKMAKVFYFSSSGGRTEDAKNVWGSDYPYLRSVEDKHESGDSWNYSWEVTYSADKIKQIMLGSNNGIGDILSIEITKVSEAGRVTELIIHGTKGRRILTNSATRTVLGQLNSQWYSIHTDADIYVINNNSKIERVQLANKKVITSSGIQTIPMQSSKITILGADGQTNTASTVPINYIFSGRGWGHAVGMSQEGAKGMALAGYKYDDILTYYFQGTQIK